MKPETLKGVIKSMSWFTTDNIDQMPSSQGYLLLELIRHYKIPAKQLGYNMDKVAVKTNKQIIVWKDTGIGARFLGLLNNDGTIEQHPDDTKPQESKMFNSMKELQKEIKKRDYNNIGGLKAKITEKDYWYFLEVLPPFKVIKNGFVLSEALSDNLYYQFTEVNNKYFCEVVMLEDEEVMQLEIAR